MKINEIFYSIQGEGNWSGIPNIFIRTSGCNLRCSYCDTKYAYNDFEEMSLDNIIQEIKKYRCNNICITGGEPLLQKDILNLIDKLKKTNYKIILETNGSINIKSIAAYNNVIISLDIKCPSSNMKDKMIFDNLRYLRKEDQLKFIIMNKEDYNYAKNFVNNNKIICSIYFQPVEGLKFKNLAEWILKDNLNVKFGLQLHKIIWNNKKGV
jgi:7-carboxy-7-deazaguanine synthase